MDGLIIDTEPIWRRSEIDTFGRLGLHLTEEQCLETMGVRVPEVVRLWYSRHPWTGPSLDEVTTEIVQRVLAHVRTAGEPQPGVLAAFETVTSAGLPIAIASSSSEELIEAVVHRLGLGRYISAIRSAEREVEGKPHPAVFLSAARALGVRPADCLALEDSPNGVLSAKRAGMFCITVPDPYLALDPRFDAADIRLASLLEFTPDLLDELMGAPARS